MSKTCFATLLIFISLQVQAQSSETFKQGIAAFKAKQFSQALSLFQRSQGSGVKTSALDYNLGATYFKLGQFTKSEQHFLKLINHKKWQALAHYNLGLIYKKQNKTNASIAEFKTAQSQTTSRKLKTLIHRQINKNRSDKKWRNTASLAIGYDNNPVLAPDSLSIINEEEESSFVETWISSERQLKKYKIHQIALNMGAYVQTYSDISRHDYYSFWLGAKYRTKVFNHKITGNLQIIPSSSDARYLSTTTSADIQIQMVILDHKIKLKEKINFIEGDSGQTYLTGWQNQLSADLSSRYKKSRYILGYQLELNDRTDLTTTSEFYSYSPLRHKIYGNLSYPISNTVQLSSRASIQHSRYGDKNSQLTLASNLVKTRADTKTQFSTSLTYKHNSIYSVNSTYRYTHNSSNFDQYQYSRHQLLAGLTVFF